MASLGSRARKLMLVLFGLVVWYSILMPLLLPATDSIVNVLASHNMTQIVIPQKVYENVNGTWQWVDKPIVIDITAVIHMILILVMAFAPIFIAWEVLT